MAKINVQHLAKLVNIPVSSKEVKKLESGFKETLESIDLLNQLDTNNLNSTFQVTGLKNIFRQDKTDLSRVLTQKQALSNAKKTYQGYFVVPSIFK
jgi:aspartyl-tRNA(Asn)/glutamyl-tRNA(Gln) amidotransferase subunit C